jgi:[CysO sulfur-carrier protein]-thiocarboxylate-dependent cysteine synthase
VRASSVLDAIGNTPVVELRSLAANAKVLAKLEGMNPSGSVKDRCALGLVRDAQKRNSLEGKTLIDASSGNLGTAVAMVGASLGIPVHLIVGSTLTHEKRRSMELLGAKLQVVEGSSLVGAKVAEQMAREDPRYYFLDQFRNGANIQVHYDTTGPEIIRDVPDVATYVCSLGSGGSLVGVARRFRADGLSVRIHAVVAEDGTRIPGLRNPGEEGGYPPLADITVIDEEHRVGMDEAIAQIRETAKGDGVLLGLSGGAVIAVAAKLARAGVPGPIVALCGDSSFKYFSKALAT